MVRNVHERRLRATPPQVGALLDRLSGEDDVLWPVDAWPSLRLDRPLGVGARGGHGPIRYTVEAYEPGRLVRFRFDPSLRIDGWHALEVVPESADVTVLRNVAQGRPRGRMRLLWPLAVRWLHDALIENLLDRAERELHGVVARPGRWSPWVRVLRAAQPRSISATWKASSRAWPLLRRGSQAVS
jgi:hypothetical protein